MSKFLGERPAKLRDAFKAAVGNVKYDTDKMDVARASVVSSLFGVISANAAALMDIDYILGNKIGVAAAVVTGAAIVGSKVLNETAKEVNKLSNRSPSI
ncbi:MAG: hypothetical protein KAS59_04355 [Alphaproteobacteria bacterium]|nr:hypothetical protein [Alphaproteobacteria bacterium]